MTPLHIRTRLRLLAGLLLLLLAAGCTSVAPYRPITDKERVDAGLAPCEKFERAADGTWNAVSLREQRRAHRLDCYAESVEHTAQYKLFYVEFDEQGRFFDRRQLDQLVEHLKRMREHGKDAWQTDNDGCRQESGGLSIVTFVHGWRHNARHDDSNVALARRVLRITHGGEETRPHHNPGNCPRQVVGVYVGWRGLSTTVTDAAGGPLRYLLAPWELLSVWDRKNTAQNVAVGSVRELLGTLRAYQELRNEEEGGYCRMRAARSEQRDKLLLTPAQREEKAKKSPPSKLLEQVYQCLAVRHMIVGHSYGALIVHNAVAQQLVESVTRGRFVTPTALRKEVQEKAAAATETPDRSRAAEDEPCLPDPASRFGGKALVRGYADLIVLLNPAVEGARYEPLYEAVYERGKALPGQMGAFCANQKPVMVVLTSENDDATGGLFPFVRAINTVFESTHPYNQSFSPEKRAYIAAEEQRSSLATIGHTRRYNTHELVGWQTYIDLPQADAARKSEEDAAEQRRLDIARIYKEAPRSPEVARNFKDMRDADESAWAIRRAHADKISARCAAGNQAFCWEPLKREGENDARTKEHQRCTRDLLADQNLAKVLASDAPGGGYGAKGWSAAFLGGTVLSHLPYYLPDYNKQDHEVLVGGPERTLPEYRAPYAPIWNVIVRDKSTMDDHGDIDGNAMVLLLAQLYRSVVLSSFDPEVIEGLRTIAHWDPSPCADIPL